MVTKKYNNKKKLCEKYVREFWKHLEAKNVLTNETSTGKKREKVNNYGWETTILLQPDLLREL